MNSTRPIIEAQKLVKAYGLLPVLRGLDLTIQRGESVSVLGPNGSGKSTLLRLMTGLTRPTAGILTIGGWKLPEESAAVRGQIGLVSHRSLLYENLTARENLLFYGRLYNLTRTELDDRIKELLAQVGLSKRAHDLTRTFSRGMQQRLSIARAVLHQPDVLLFDEPHTGLDQSATTTLDNLLKNAGNEGRTVVMVTHQFDKALELTNRVVIISRGVVGYDAPSAGLTTSQLAEIYGSLN
ncbi:MAG TPA: heme ABC exporter ATP-binding protein CcmA [Phototrophicaceae bacterium]|nr:heme ABC exporter ATP-binding protein CcmA [Phototrophicaceae bacterium]